MKNNSSMLLKCKFSLRDLFEAGQSAFLTSPMILKFMVLGQQFGHAKNFVIYANKINPKCACSTFFAIENSLEK